MRFQLENSAAKIICTCDSLFQHSKKSNYDNHVIIFEFQQRHWFNLKIAYNSSAQDCNYCFWARVLLKCCWLAKHSIILFSLKQQRCEFTAQDFLEIMKRASTNSPKSSKSTRAQNLQPTCIMLSSITHKHLKLEDAVAWVIS